MHNDLFSYVYEIIRKTWFGAWTWNSGTYGPRDVKKIEVEGNFYKIEMKAGTMIRHGRQVTIYTHGGISDCFYKENKLHGPSLWIYPNGTYEIEQYKDGEYLSS